MKRVLTNILAIATLSLYILSFVGFGVHECSCTGSHDIILLPADLSCENIHSHEYDGQTIIHHDHDCTCGHDHSEDSFCHTDDCCNTEIIYISDDRDLPQDDSNELYQSIKILLATSEHDICGSHNHCCDVISGFKEAPPLLYTSDIQPLISQWIL